MALKTIHLTFPADLIQEPIIYRLDHKFKVVTNLFQAAVGEKDAWIVLELDGEQEEIEGAIGWLRDLGIRVEERPQP